MCYKIAITTYINAYGKYSNSDYNIYDIPNALMQKDLLVKPSIEVFCIPPFEIIKERMEKSKDSPVHDYYRKNPKFLRIVYDELENKAKEYDNSIIIDTSSDISVNKGIEKILKYIQQDKKI